MTVTKGETFTKDVAFKATDEERRVAIGGVMIPDKVDRQGDYVRGDLIEEFSDGFMARLPDGDAVPGVMHAVFPEEHVSLVENRVLESEQEIGGKTFDAGTWVQGWKFHDDELWALVSDGVLSGYSIGASSVEWSEPMSQDELPDDVDVAADYPDDEPVWQILDGKINEVSSVDIPAVPDAVMVAAKAGGAKSILDRVGGKNEFVGVMEDRGASEDQAERMWHYLQRALEETDGKAAPQADDSTLARLGKSVLNALTGSDISKATDDGAPSPEETKEGRTLSRANRDSLFASVDATLDVLEDGGVDHGMTRFTDRDDVGFTIDDYGAREWRTIEPNHDPGDVTPDSDNTTMSDDDIDIEEKFEALEKRLDEIEEQAKTDEDDDDSDKDVDDDGSGLEDKIDSLEEKLDNLAEASGKSQQLSGGNDEADDGPTKADILGIPGGDN